MAANQMQIHGKKKRKHSVSVPYLNNDILWNIFKRVPATPLLHNCSFLSKQCSKLIRNHNFVKHHFLHSNYGILLYQKNDQKKVLKFMEFQNTQCINLHYLHTLNEYQSFSSTSGAGLSILHDSKDYHIVNIITKETIPLPHPKQSHLGLHLLFDRANINYKILYFSANYNRETKWELTVHLLDLDDGSYKHIKGPKLPTLGMPLLANGVLYCKANEKGLFSLDLSTETFSFLKWPVDTDSLGFYFIIDVGGSVGFAAIDRSQDICIWILREEKWVQRFYTDKQHPIPGIPTWKDPSFLGCLGRDQDLFVFTRDSNRLDAYNLKTKQWTMIKPADDNLFMGMHVTTILPLTSKMVSWVDAAQLS